MKKPKKEKPKKGEDKAAEKPEEGKVVAKASKDKEKSGKPSPYQVLY